MTKSITVTLSDGRKITVPEDRVIALTDPTPLRTTASAAPSAEVVALTDNVTKLTGIVEKLITRDAEREKSSGEREARARVAKLVQDRKLLKKQESWAVAYCLSDPKGFDTYADTLVPLFSSTQRGTGENNDRTTRTHTSRDAISGESISATDGDVTQTGAEQEFNDKVEQYLTDHKLNPNKRDDLSKAMRAVALADPELETRRRAEMENAVIPFSRTTGVNRHSEVAS